MWKTQLEINAVSKDNGELQIFQTKVMAFLCFGFSFPNRGVERNIKYLHSIKRTPCKTAFAVRWKACCFVFISQQDSARLGTTSLLLKMEGGPWLSDSTHAFQGALPKFSCCHLQLTGLRYEVIGQTPLWDSGDTLPIRLDNTEKDGLYYKSAPCYYDRLIFMPPVSMQAALHGSMDSVRENFITP